MFNVAICVGFMNLTIMAINCLICGFVHVKKAQALAHLLILQAVILKSLILLVVVFIDFIEKCAAVHQKCSLLQSCADSTVTDLTVFA